MGLRVRKRSGPAIPPMDAGTYAAVCVGVVDLGEQYSETFKKYSDKVLLINLSGRGDKDVTQVAALMRAARKENA